MNANQLLAASKQRRSRAAQFGALFWAAVTVFTGLLLGVLYCLLTHQIPS